MYEVEQQSSQGGHGDLLVSAHADFSPMRKGIRNVGTPHRTRVNFQWFSSTVALFPLSSQDCHSAFFVVGVGEKDVGIRDVGKGVGADTAAVGAINRPLRRVHTVEVE